MKFTAFIDSVGKEVLKCCLTSSRKWSKVNRNYNMFEKIISEWQNTLFKTPIKKINSVSVTIAVSRPSKPFIVSSEKSQIRKITCAISSRITSPEIVCDPKKHYITNNINRYKLNIYASFIYGI